MSFDIDKKNQQKIILMQFKWHINGQPFGDIVPSIHWIMANFVGILQPKHIDLVTTETIRSQFDRPKSILDRSNVFFSCDRSIRTMRFMNASFFFSIFMIFILLC